MDAKRIQELLDKYYRFTPPHGAQKKAVAQAVKDVCNISITEDVVVIRNATAHLHIDAASKSFLHLHKDRVLTYLHNELHMTRITHLQ